LIPALLNWKTCLISTY